MTHTEIVLSTLRAGGRADLAQLAEQHGVTVKHVETHHGPADDPTTAVRSDLWHIMIGEGSEESDVCLALSLLRRLETSSTSLMRVSISCTLLTEQPPTIEAAAWVIRAWESEGWHQALS